ncbi:MAG: cupin domain-containing protein [Gammaproteobacteria bacterium]
MPAKPFVMTQQEYVCPYEVLGMHITVLVSGEKTGSYELVPRTGPEGSGLPPHRHPWDESNYVIKGDVEFGLGEEITWGTAGTVIHFPAGTEHAYRFGRGGAVMVSITSRPGAARLFAALDRELPPGEAGPATLIEIGARYGLTVVG